MDSSLNTDQYVRVFAVRRHFCMTILRKFTENNHVCHKDGALKNLFEYRPRFVQWISTERRIEEMRDIIIASKNGVECSEVEQQACVKSENPSNIILDLQQISEKVGFEQVDKLFEKIFEDDLVIEALKLRFVISELQEIIVD